MTKVQNGANWDWGCDEAGCDVTAVTPSPFSRPIYWAIDKDDADATVTNRAYTKFLVNYDDEAAFLSDWEDNGYDDQQAAQNALPPATKEVPKGRERHFCPAHKKQ